MTGLLLNPHRFPAPGAAGYAAAVLADGASAHWRLGEASGTTMVDASPNGRHGTYFGSPALGASGLLTGDADTCVDFDGVNDYGLVTYGSWMNPASLTLEAVIRPDSVTGSRTIIARRDANTLAAQSYQLRVSDGKLQLLFLYGGGNVKTASSTAPLSVGTTYHVGATYDGSNIRLLIGGTLDSTTAHVGGYNTGSSNLRIGGIDQLGGAGFEERFDGKIDEPAVYGTALAASRLAVHAALV